MGRKRSAVASRQPHRAWSLWCLGLGQQRFSVVLTGRADAAVIVEVAFIFSECRLMRPDRR